MDICSYLDFAEIRHFLTKVELQPTEVSPISHLYRGKGLL